MATMNFDAIRKGLDDIQHGAARLRAVIDAADPSITGASQNVLPPMQDDDNCCGGPIPPGPLPPGEVLIPYIECAVLRLESRLTLIKGEVIAAKGQLIAGKP